MFDVNNIFKISFYYSNARVCRFIEIIQTTDSEKRKVAFKQLVFRMMKDIVNKNISNYLNLITNTKLVEEPPEYGELIADCYIIFNTCVNGFKLGHNFYFYFNKSLSRNFFRNYQKLVKQKNTVFELTDAIEAINEEMHVAHNHVSIELVMEQLEMNELEKRICRSKLNGQKSAEFFEENEDVTQFEYSQALKSVKVKLKQII